MASGEDDAELESSEDEMGDELEHVVFIHHDLQESDVCAHCPCTQPPIRSADRRRKWRHAPPWLLLLWTPRTLRVTVGVRICAQRDH